jgi:transcription elongation GreA/GreB family factor
MMHANDMRNPAVRRSFTEAKERARVEAERQKVRDREERLEEMRDRLNAATRTSVSMNRDQPWTQNSSGRRYKGKG